jgi:polyisoprenoid-binding protein YceI
MGPAAPRGRPVGLSGWNRVNMSDTSTAHDAKPYVIDASHSSVEFSVRHLVFAKVRGQFRVISGTLEVAPDGVPTAIEAEIQANSVDSREEQRDNHLRSTDFLDAANYPTLTFSSAQINKKSETEFTAIGDLTIHGTANRVEFSGTIEGRGADPWGNDRIAYTAKTTINRKDYGLTWSQTLEGGGLLVGEDVEIELDIQAIPART